MELGRTRVMWMHLTDYQWERFLWKFPSQLGNTVLMLRMLSDADSIVTASTIRKWTNTDPLSMVRRMVLQGWESQLEPEFKPYMQRRYELSVQIGCVLWGSRVVVSPLGRTPILRLQYEGHPGIRRMKALARSVVWWPGLDAELDNKVKYLYSMSGYS